MRLIPKRRPIDSVAEAQRRAKKKLPRAVYMSVLAGHEQAISIRDNIAAFKEISFRTRVGISVPPVRDLSTTLLGETLPFPVVISPAGVQAIAPGGEVPLARAAAQEGTAMGLSNFASMPVESVTAANPKTFVQLYWTGSRDIITQRVERARRAGAKAIIATVDFAPLPMAQDWPMVPIPQRLNLATMVKFAPAGLTHPNWLLGFLLHGGLPDLKVPNLATPQNPSPTMMEAAFDWAMTPMPSWDDLKWLREIWGGPFMIKGIMNAEDARKAVDIGATAISVSNHGGNALDSTPSPLRVLPEIVRAVGDSIEVAYDGGIRRGGDVVKALALGARAVMVGRPWIFALAAGGEQGVREVLGVLRSGIDTTLVALGHASIHELSPEDLLVRDGFELTTPASRRKRVSAGSA